MQARAVGRRPPPLAAAVAAAAVTALVVGIGATARSESAAWPDGRVAALWPAFALLPQKESGGGARTWDGKFRRCIQSARVQLDYRCEYVDAAGRLGYICLWAGDPVVDLSRGSIDAVVAPRDPTFAAASPGQVCTASLAYSLSLG